MAVRSDAARPRSEFLLEHRAFVVRLCRILLRDADEAEDAAQQVFLNAHRAVGSGVRPLNVRAWLAQIVRNECRSRARHAAAHPEAPLRDSLPTVGPDPADAVEQRLLVARLRQELAALPERQREALLLREFRGLSYDELAAAMDETGPAVESLLQRARRRLVTRLADVRRPFVGTTLVVDWLRNAVSRLFPGSAATEAVATGGTAAVVAKLTAAGVVAVGVSAAGGDVSGPSTAPAARQPAPPTIATRSMTTQPPTFALTVASRGPRGPSGESGHGGRSGRSGGSDEPSSSSGSGEAPSVTSGEAPQPSGSSSSGPGPDGSGSGTSGSSESGSGSSSSGPGSGRETTSSSGSPEQSGSGSSSSSGPGPGSTEPTGSSSSGPGPSGSGSGSGSDGTSGHTGSGSDSSSPDD